MLGTTARRVLRSVMVLVPLTGLLGFTATPAGAFGGTQTQVFAASNCTVTVSVTVDASVPAKSLTITSSATCTINGYGSYVSDALVTADDGLACQANARNGVYPVTSVGPASCTEQNPLPGQHNVAVSMSFDPHDIYYSPGCGQDTSFDPSYERCSWSMSVLVI